MAKPAEQLKDIAAGLRADVQKAIADARAAKQRVPQSLSALQSASKDLHGFLDVADATTAEINGLLLGDDGDNGAPADTVGNSGAASAPPPVTSPSSSPASDSSSSSLPPLLGDGAVKMLHGVPVSMPGNAAQPAGNDPDAIRRSRGEPVPSHIGPAS